MYNQLDIDSTIVAPATASGGAVMVIRLSGKDAIAIADKMFYGRKPLHEAEGYTLHYGTIRDGERTIDDVVVALFRAPHSYTGDDTVEITAHGSQYITSELLRMAIEHGARMATAGEFTRRAFLAGKMDLSRAEAVADIIASDSRWSHRIATTQMRGGYSEQLASLREKLLHLCSLLELELDFSEEDVEFADRKQLRQLLEQTLAKVESLAQSFALGNALKEGVQVAIVGRPNVGKSTLLNRLAGEDRAMVSDIAGTTRDTVEVCINIDGVMFRLIDTAGLHSTSDRLEQMGIERTAEALRKARIVLWLTDNESSCIDDDLVGYTPTTEQHVYRIITKIDLSPATSDKPTTSPYPTIRLSALTGEGVDKLRGALHSSADATGAYNGDVIVSNHRHYEALRKAQEALAAALTALHNDIPTDLMSEEIRLTIHHIGTITGEITSDDILKNIFSHFCVGK